MVSLDTIQATPPPRSSIEPASSPRISFSAEFLDDINTNTNNNNNFITICPSSPSSTESSKTKARIAADFEFLSSGDSLGSQSMITADELFFEGKLLPFWQAHGAEKLSKISLKVNKEDEDHDHDHHDHDVIKQVEDGNSTIRLTSNTNSATSTATTTTSWFVDDDPSPRPPKCTVLWKELLRLKKQRATSTLSPSSSSSSSSSSASSLADAASGDEGSRHGSGREKHHHHHQHQHHHGKGMRKGLERTRSATIRIRPMINVPICTTQVKSSVATSHHALPPLFPLKKGKLER